MTNAIGVVLMLLGAAMAVWAIIGRRIGSEPRCGRCAFDLSGHGDALATCPECGATLSAATTVRGVRRRHWILAALAGVAVVFGTTLAIDLANARRLKHMPTWWLVHVERHITSAAWRQQVNAELTQRLMWGTAGVDELTPVVDDIRERQRRAHDMVARGETPFDPWDSEETLFVCLAFSIGGIPQDDFANFALDALDVSAVAEPAVAAGALRPRLVVQASRGPPTAANAAAMIGGLTVMPLDLSIAGRTVPLGGSAGGSSLFPQRQSVGPTELALDLPAGTHTGTFRARLRVGNVERIVERPFTAEVLAEDRAVDYTAIERELATNLSLLQARRGTDTIEVTATWSRSVVRPPDSATLLVVERHIASTGASSRSDGIVSTLQWTFPFPADAALPELVVIEFPWLSLEAPGLDGLVGIVSEKPVRLDVPVVVPEAR